MDIDAWRQELLRLNDPVQWAFFTGMRLLGAHDASAFLRDGVRPMLVSAARLKSGEVAAETIQVPVGEGVAGLVAERGIPFFGVRESSTFICVPIHGEDRIEGVINLTERAGDEPFTEEHVSMASLVAAHIGRILEQKRHESSSIASPLPNRQAFEEILERELARSKRAGMPFQIAFVGVTSPPTRKRAATVREDDLLRRLCSATRTVLRRYDFAGQWSDSELALLLAGPTSQSTGLIERITSALNKVTQSVDTGIKISVGLAHCPEDGISAQELIAKAGMRMDKQRIASLV